MIAAIFAHDLGGSFGNDTGLPWPVIKEDLQHFKAITTKYKNMLMGSNTARLLPDFADGRKKWVVSSTNEPDFKYDRLIAPSALAKQFNYGICDFIIIGGPSLLFPTYLEKCDEIYQTVVKGVYRDNATVHISPYTLAYLREGPFKEEVIKDTENCIIRRFYR